jgi:hypothetical protein
MDVYTGTAIYRGDPIRSRSGSRYLCNSIQAYYDEKGQYGVRCVVVQKYRPIEHFAIRSNLRFDALDADASVTEYLIKQAKAEDVT